MYDYTWFTRQYIIPCAMGLLYKAIIQNPTISTFQLCTSQCVCGVKPYRHPAFIEHSWQLFDGTVQTQEETVLVYPNGFQIL